MKDEKYQYQKPKPLYKYNDNYKGISPKYFYALIFILLAIMVSVIILKSR